MAHDTACRSAINGAFDHMLVDEYQDVNPGQLDLIDRIEDALKTPVQTAVKREDEQAFALLNGENLMFCEGVASKRQWGQGRRWRATERCPYLVHLAERSSSRFPDSASARDWALSPV